MKKSTFILSLIGGLFIMTSLSSCGVKDKAEIEQSFEKVLNVYPTKNLEDFYDLEGYRDEEFDKEDKGTWYLHSSMATQQTKNSPLITQGMLLRMNRNTRKSDGYYFIRNFTDNLEDNTEEQYPITYDEQGFHLVEEVVDPELKKTIENFQFFVQYGQFNNLDQYENIRKMYNPEVPMYNLEYQLTNTDTNVKALRERYDISITEAPTLLLSGRGALEGSSIGSKEIEIRFSKIPPVVFRNSISFQPSNEEDTQ